MSSSQPFVSKYWPRKKEAPDITDENTPLGIHTPNMRPWGHKEDEFYWLKRFPAKAGNNASTVWSISMIREFGEKDEDTKKSVDNDLYDAYKTRVRKPWPLLKLPDGLSCEQEIGVQDEGSVYCLNCNNPSYQRVAAACNQVPKVSSQSVEGSLTLETANGGEAESLHSFEAENPSQPIEIDILQTVKESFGHEPAEDGEVETLQLVEAENLSQPLESDLLQTIEESSDHATADGGEAESLPAVKTDDVQSANQVQEHGQPDGDACENDQDPSETEDVAENIYGTDLPPKLEEFLPKEFFPDVLMVHDSDDCAVGDQGRSGWRRRSKAPSSVVYRYKRVLPEVEIESGPDSNLKVASLHLAANHLHGRGNHSSVYRAPFSLPPPLTANSRSKDGCVTVIAKTGFSSSSHRELLEKEAHVFNKLSSDEHRHMQQEWCGLNTAPPQWSLFSLVPVGPVVPKFYGYYIPEQGVDDDKNLSPILLMEDCGLPVQAEELSHAGRLEVLSLFFRLHNAGFVHNSPYVRNMLVQPGPLTRSPSQRSIRTPSFRLIDFGRVKRLEDYRAEAGFQDDFWPISDRARACLQVKRFEGACKNEYNRVDKALGVAYDIFGPDTP
ncbi:MAG: hypothetical protein M1816_007402 [Peltula sp. TS41687]|nr:MAG: hypothetical protein M1816_007402 [Peltula sp. TS41687]